MCFCFASAIVCEKNLKGIDSALGAVSAFAFHSGPSAELENHCYSNENTTVQSLSPGGENSLSITLTK